MTAFTDEQIAALRAPLAREHVKSRDQGRGKVSYIEGWHAIAEMNRIFGFDGWTRETVMSECCHAGPYQKAVYENGQRTNKTVESFRCSYRARVRITVGNVVREGSGHGHGFADNPGEAHESAEKEAETDAMKRGLMTFGNPLGLALYDKTQSEVEPIQRRAAAPAGERNDLPPSRVLPDRTAPQAPAAAPRSEEAERRRRETRQNLISGWFRRDDYGIDPEAMEGGLAAWDGWFLEIADACPGLDALLRLRADNKDYLARWWKGAAEPVRDNFKTRIGGIEAKLSEKERAAA